VQSEFIADIYKPYGAWKVEPNGTYAVTEEGQQTFIEYAAPEDVPALMSEWLAELNRLADADLTETAAMDAYAKLHLGFVHIHPFWDGNGRMARLLGNIPVLRSGHLPVVIDIKDRKEYIDTLAKYELSVGQLTRTTGVWPVDALMAAFQEFCHRSYHSTRQLIEQVKAQQSRRNANRRQR
jgi:Fic family protein